MIEEIEDPEAEIEDVEETEEEEGVVEDSEEEEHPKYLSSLIDSQAYSLPVDSKTLLWLKILFPDNQFTIKSESVLKSTVRK